MSIVVLLILAIVWAVFLVPQFLRSRSEADPKDSIGAFRQQLTVLERAAPARIPAATRIQPVGRSGLALAPPAPRMGMTLSEAQKRRRDILCGLLGAMAATLVLGLIPALRSLLTLHLVLDGVFIAYVALLARARALATQREEKVSLLPGAAPHPEPAFALRRAAN